MGFSFGKSWERSFDEYLTNPPEPEESHFMCSECKDVLYPDDRYFELDGQILCEGCAAEWLESQAQTVSYEQAFGE